MPEGVFQLSLLTPEQNLLETAARAVVLRSSDGDLTVLDGHTPLVTDVVPSDVRVDPEEGEPVHVAVHGGYLHVETAAGLNGADARSTRVTLLAGVAELADQIDVPRAERARTEAESRVEQLRSAAGRGPGAITGEAATASEGIELADAEAALQRAELRLRVAGASS